VFSLKPDQWETLLLKIVLIGYDLKLLMLIKPLGVINNEQYFYSISELNYYILFSIVMYFKMLFIPQSVMLADFC